MQGNLPVSSAYAEMRKLSAKPSTLGPVLWNSKLTLHLHPIWAPVQVSDAPLLIQLLTYNLGKQWGVAHVLRTPCTYMEDPESAHDSQLQTSPALSMAATRGVNHKTYV